MIRKFNRYEFKYLLTHKDHLRVAKALEGFLARDANAGEKGVYRIASLYYDSPGLSCYRNKIDGIKYRRKLRLRVYKDSDMTHGFVEIKQRINRTVQKRRLVLPVDEAKALCSGEDIGVDRLDTTDRETAAEVRFLVKALGMKPQCIISYQRRPFEGSRYDYGLRVTFDTYLKYRIHALDLVTDANNRFFLSPDIVVMEIKANEKVPIWLMSLVSALQCDIRRVSKYCMGVEQAFSTLRNSRVTL
jgi:SPX domain protein involved in polyphosphate accumulation